MAKQKELNMNVCNMNPWQKQFLALMGIVDEGEIVSLVDYEESPFQRYIPFLGHERGYLKATNRIVNKLLDTVKEKRGF